MEEHGLLARAFELIIVRLLLRFLDNQARCTLQRKSSLPVALDHSVGKNEHLYDESAYHLGGKYIRHGNCETGSYAFV